MHMCTYAHTGLDASLPILCGTTGMGTTNWYSPCLKGPLERVFVSSENMSQPHIPSPSLLLFVIFCAKRG